MPLIAVSLTLSGMANFYTIGAMSMPHVCSLYKSNEKQGPSVQKPFWERFKSKIKSYLQVSQDDPRCIEFFRSATGLQRERKRQSDLGYDYIIHPMSKFKWMHEYVMTITFYIFFLVFPITLSFEVVIEVEHLTWNNQFEAVLSIIFIVDIILRFFMGDADYHTKEITLEPRIIAKKYVFSIYFITDVLSSLPTDMVYIYTLDFTYQYLGVLKILKFVRIDTCIKYFYRSALRFNLNSGTVNVTIYFFLSYLVVHWAACLQFLVPHLRSLYYGELHPDSWINTQQIRISVFADYVLCVHRASGLLVGASAPFQNLPWEENLMACEFIIAGRIYLLSIAVILMTVTFDAFALETKYQEVMNQLQEYMKYKKFPLMMRQRMVQYYEYKFQKKFFREKVIREILSEKLKREINVYLCKQLVQNVSVFTNISQKILSDILNQLKSEIYLPNDIIIKAGAVGDCMYFLASGTVAVYTPSGKEICHLQDGAYFGEISLLLRDLKRTANVVALEICEVFRLDKKVFKALIRPYQYEVLSNIQEVAEMRLQKTLELEESYKLELFQKAYLAYN